MKNENKQAIVSNNQDARRAAADNIVERAHALLDRVEGAIEADEVIPGGGAAETASITFAIGDANNNGRTDVSVRGHVFGRPLPQLVRDIDFSGALRLLLEVRGMIARSLGLAKVAGIDDAHAF